MCFSSEVKHRKDWRFNHTQCWQLHQLAALYPHTRSHTHTHTHSPDPGFIRAEGHCVWQPGADETPHTQKHNLHRQVWCSGRGEQLTHTHTTLTATGAVDHSHTSNTQKERKEWEKNEERWDEKIRGQRQRQESGRWRNKNARKWEVRRDDIRKHEVRR